MRRLQFNGIVERLHKDLDASVVSYNTKSPHQGRGLKLAPKPDLEPREKEPQQGRLIKLHSGSDCLANTEFVHISE